MRNTFTKATMLSTLLFLTALFFSFSTVNAGENTGTSTQHMNQGNPGDHHDGPPIDPRSGHPFTRADEVKYQKYADECEANNGLLSEGSAQTLVADGFTRIQLDKLCKASANHHDGPPSMTGDHHAGAPGTAPGYAPGTAPGYAPGTAPGYAPGTAPGYAPGTAPGYAPGTAPGYAPGTAPGYAPGTAPGYAPTRG